MTVRLLEIAEIELDDAVHLIGFRRMLQEVQSAPLIPAGRTVL